MEKTEKKKCKLCKKTLKAIGNSRKNGANHNDWKSREYHKKCWKEVKDNERVREFFGLNPNI